MAELPFQRPEFRFQRQADYKHPGMISQGGKKNNLYQASPPPLHLPS
jgi:hypothetical protein